MSCVASRDQPVVVKHVEQLAAVNETSPQHCRHRLHLRRKMAIPRIGSALVVRQGDALLLARRDKEPNKGKWIFPGGKIEPFESIKAAARRELLEETGLHVHVDDQIGAFEIIRPPDEHRVIIFSWAHAVGGTLAPNDDVSELRFCTRAELAELDLSEIVAWVAAAIGWLEAPTAAAA
jgi:ADP-ribose pyrophosphatase YjhB (NUDIX family)